MMRNRRIEASILLTGLFVLTFSCSPSPKYRSRRKTVPAPVTTKSPPPAVKRTETTLIHPVYNFHTSRVTSLFGLRRHPRYDTRSFHTGIDIDAEVGDEVIAAASGRIIFSGNQQGYGKVLIIEHQGDLCTVYAHLSSFAVDPGTEVVKGQVIGRVGVTGNATGSHLHFEVRIGGKTVDPFDYLPRSR